MSMLKINLLGNVRITHDGIEINDGMGRIVTGLLGYITLFHHRFHTREFLAGLFWGGSSEDRARSSLSTTLWRLRKILEPGSIPAGAYLLTTPAGEVGFNRQSDHWLDIEFFENRVTTALDLPYASLHVNQVRQLEDALNIYGGELLEGFYDDWALRERERLRLLFVKGQSHLLHYFHHQGAWDQGLSCARKIIDLDPLREEIHRKMMRLYFENGERTQALRQYQKCREILASELGVAPMEETQQLYRRILESKQSKLPESKTPLNIA